MRFTPFLLILFSSFSIFTHSARLSAEEYSWVVPTTEELTESRTQIQQAMFAVDNLLGDTQSRSAWQRYLLWEDLLQAVDEEIGTDVAELDEARNRLLPVLTRLSDNQAGLERPEIGSLRFAIRTHVRQINALLVRRGAQEAEARRRNVTELIAANRWTAAAQSEYHAHLRWLDDHQQPLPKSLLPTHWNNLSATLSATLIREATATPVTDPTDVNECIVGTRVIGKGVTSGLGWLEPVSAESGAHLRARFTGVLTSDTVGYNGPVRIFSDGRTRLDGTALLRLDQTGLRQLYSHVDASADSTTKGISTKFKGLLDRIVRNVATKKAAQSKAQANWESSYKARESFSLRFGEDISNQVNDGDTAFQRDLRLPLLRRGLMPAAWTWESDSQALRTRLSFAGRERPASPVAVPTRFTSNGTPAGLQLAVHQSFIDNVAEGYFGGQIRELSELVTSGEKESSSKPVEDVLVTFDDFQPLRSVFDNDTLTFHFLPKQIYAAGRATGGLIIKVSYRIERTATGFQLRRTASPTMEPQPTYSRKPRFDASGSAMRVIIEPRLIDDMPETLPLSWHELTVNQASESVPKAVRDLRLVDAQAFGGWLFLSLR